MRAITIRQPWATLIALGEKRFETRSRRTHIRGPLAIHAGKNVDREACEREPIKSTLAKHGYTAENLPTGAIIATCNLSDCLAMGAVDGDRISLAGNRVGYLDIESNEYHFGWYERGRFANELTNVKRINPIPVKGQQGFWFFNGLEGEK